MNDIEMPVWELMEVPLFWISHSPMSNKYKQNIQDFWVSGINYQNSDASTRGAFAVGNEQMEELFKQAPDYGVHDFFVLSTCNRTEIYGFADQPERLNGLLCSVCPGDAKTFSDISYAKNGYEAVHHLFLVAGGLNSQILGDFEILGQVKNAVKVAKSHGSVNTLMERLVNSVIQASKAIKTHTALSGGVVSVSFAAIQYIREHFEGPSLTPLMTCPFTSHMITPPSSGATIAASVEDKKVVLLGAGKIGRTTCRNVIDYLDTRNVTLINRTEETAIKLAEELNIQSAPIERLEAELDKADIIIVSTSAPEPVITQKHLEGKGDKLVIDLSVPCNVSADARKLPGVTFVDIDMLSRIKDETLSKRREEIPRATAIIDEHMADFREWQDMRKHVPMLREVKNKLEEIYAGPVLVGGSDVDCECQADTEKIKKVINSLAAKIRQNNTPGCNYIQAINEFIA